MTPAQRTPRKAVKAVKAWAVVFDGQAYPVGTTADNGGPNRWQYPLFYKRAEARDYATESHGAGMSVVRVLITELPPAARQRRGKA